jgi:flagellar basal-body rod protein FlgF/flagellar basal-body rod protein FlgG
MPYGFYISAEGAHAQDRRLQVIAANLANADTVGFKRELAIFQARHAEAISQGLQPPGTGALEDLGGGIVLKETKTEFSPGPLKATGKPGDLAIEGEGFFVVRRGEETFLTRAGNFHLTANGALVTQAGDAVLSDTGAPIVLPPENGPWEVSATGVIQQQRGGAQSLAIVAPTSHAELTKVGENLFRAAAPPQAVPLALRRVAHRFLEQSTVKPTTEMVELIEASRALEANLNLLRAQDQMLAGLVNRLLKV